MRTAMKICFKEPLKDIVTTQHNSSTETLCHSSASNLCRDLHVENKALRFILKDIGGCADQTQVMGEHG